MTFCPYCLKEGTRRFEVKGHSQVYVCPHCKRELPRDLPNAVDLSIVKFLPSI